jgi:hypothetical protein
LIKRYFGIKFFPPFASCDHERAQRNPGPR